MSRSNHSLRFPAGLVRAARGASCIALLVTSILIVPGAPERLAQSAQTARTRAARRTLAQQLAERAGVSFEARPLRDVLARLRSDWDLPIFLDRRIDPDQWISLDLPDSSLSDIVAATARAAGAEMQIIGTLVYLGPAEQSETVAALCELRYEQTAELPAALAPALRKRAAIQWPALSEPRALVQQQAELAGLRITHPDAIPHDLWDAQQWPELSLSHRLSLLLAGFDLTYRIDAAQRAIVLEAIPEQFTFTRNYALSRDAEPRWRELEPMLSSVRTTRRGGRLTVTATAAEHARIRQALSPAPAARPAVGTSPDSQVRYTLRVRGPFRQVASGLGERLKLKVELDPATRATWDQTVDLQVQDVTLAQLLAELVGSVGLAYDLQGERVRIHAGM